MSPRTPRPARRLLLVLLSGGALCACSSEPSVAGSAAAERRTSPAATASPTPSPDPATSEPSEAVSPLTGLPVSQAVSREPVVAVPVQTGTGRTAPVGLDVADLAYVAFPGPERQRVLALYHSRPAEQVGPVAQTRPMDGKLVGVFDAVLQYGGGPSSFVRQLQRAEVTEWSSLTQAAGFTRDASGLLYASPAEARDAPGAEAAVAGVLAFSDAEASEEGDAREVRVSVPSQPPLTLRYDVEERLWQGAMGDLPIAATNVVLQEVAYEQLILPKTGGATERDPVLVGADGQATVLRPSGAVQGSWNRRGRDTLTSYVGDGSLPVRFAPGTTRVLLVPEGTAIEGAGD